MRGEDLGSPRRSVVGVWARIRGVPAQLQRMLEAGAADQRARCVVAIERASRGDFVGPPPALSLADRTDHQIFGKPFFSERRKAWALAHTIDQVWAPVLRSTGVDARADVFCRAAGVGPEMFLAIVTGQPRGRGGWRRSDVAQMAAGTGIPAATITELNKHMAHRWEAVFLCGHDLTTSPVRTRGALS